jgi:CRP/FNR family transcriptional regulator
MTAGFSLLPDIVGPPAAPVLGTPRRRRVDEPAYPMVRVRRLAARETLFRAGEPTGDLHEITRGTLLVVRHLADGRRQIVDIAGPGRLLGLGLGARHVCTAIAVWPTVVSSFDGDDALDHPIVAARVERAAFAEIDRLRELALSLGRRTAIERLAAFFVALAGDDDDEATAVVPLSVGRGDIADHLGLTLETVSRTIGRLKKDGLLIEEKGEAMLLPDPRRLRALAAGDVGGLDG